MSEIQVPSQGREDPPERNMATHSSILAWRILWTEEPGGLLSTGHRVRHDSIHTQTHIYQNGINRDKGKYNITTAIRAREQDQKGPLVLWYNGLQSPQRR